MIFDWFVIYGWRWNWTPFDLSHLPRKLILKVLRSLFMQYKRPFQNRCKFNLKLPHKQRLNMYIKFVSNIFIYGCVWEFKTIFFIWTARIKENWEEEIVLHLRVWLHFLLMSNCTNKTIPPQTIRFSARFFSFALYFFVLCTKINCNGFFNFTLISFIKSPLFIYLIIFVKDKEILI